MPGWISRALLLGLAVAALAAQGMALPPEVRYEATPVPTVVPPKPLFAYNGGAFEIPDGIPEAWLRQAVTVMLCESKANPHAIGSSQEVGLLQIHPIHKQRVEAMGYTWDQMYQPVPNVLVAYAIWNEQGWAPWSCPAERR